MVSFKEFSKLELKVGKIVSAQDHPQADKLYLLKVETGEGVKQAVAGIKRSYSLEELKDKEVVVLTNLEPKKIRGELSECMVLAAQSEEAIILIAPEKDAKIGSKIR